MTNLAPEIAGAACSWVGYPGGDRGHRYICANVGGEGRMIPFLECGVATRLVSSHCGSIGILPGPACYEQGSAIVRVAPRESE